jgi:hypothetical protein
MAIKRTAALLTTAGIAALAVTGATAAGASSTPSDIEHWTVESTNPVSATATLIARGPLTVGGTINLLTGHVQLPGGTLTLSHHQAWAHRARIRALAWPRSRRPEPTASPAAPAATFTSVATAPTG